MLLTLLIHKWFSYAQVTCTVQEEEEEEEGGGRSCSSTGEQLAVYLHSACVIMTFLSELKIRGI